MRPAPFLYFDPRTRDEAVQLLREHADDVVILAGGQSLVPLLNLRLSRPAVVVDVNRIPDHADVAVDEHRVQIGALARASTVERHREVAKSLPVLRDALRHVGHPQIRNRTTIGGNVAHADPASELPCVLAALDGSITLASIDGERTVAWDDFFESAFATTRRDNEMVVSVEVPRPPAMAFDFRELARRSGDFAMVGTCVGVRHDGDVVTEARVALLGVSSRPVRCSDVEAFLTGRVLDDLTITEAQRLTRDALDPPDDIHASSKYRRAAGGVLVGRGLRALAGGHG